MLAIIRRAVVFAALLLVLTASFSFAEGKLNFIEHFTQGQQELAVLTFYDPAQKKGDDRAGLIGIATPERNSFAFNGAEWDELIALCDKAAKVQSDSWTEVGSLTEHRTSDVSHMTVSAGPGMKIVISSANSGTVSYTLEKKDVPRLQSGLQKVKTFLAEK